MKHHSTCHFVRLITLSLSLFLGVNACHAQAPSPPPQKHWRALKDALKLTPPKRQEALKKLLSPLEYSVTQEEGTERPFKNRYWDLKRPGLYVDVISGEPLFSSAHKFDSGTGWPSFDRPLSPTAVRKVRDERYGVVRVEVRSTSSDAHLGHVFDDGPSHTTGLRYCMNSAALRFVPLEELKAQGYGAWLERAGLEAPQEPLKEPKEPLKKTDD